MESYKDKVVVVTGGATGIGFAFAKAFGAEGARVVLGAHQEDRLQQAVDQLVEQGVDACYCLCDVSKREQVEALADFAWERHGRVDVILNNAGVGQGGTSVLEADTETVRALFDVNFWGVWHGSQVFGQRFVEQDGEAAIYNVGSENSLFNAAPGAAYVASKHAVLGFSEALRKELPDSIGVSVICPGFTRSELIPEPVRPLGMDTDRFVAIAMEQLRAGRFFVVTHAFNAERIDQRYQEIKTAYDTYAPRYDGDEEYDVWTLLAKMG